MYKLDGLPNRVQRMPDTFYSCGSPVTGGKEPRHLGTMDGIHFKLSRMEMIRKKSAATPLAFSRMRHIKLARKGWHGGEESPSQGYLAESEQKKTLCKTMLSCGESESSLESFRDAIYTP